MMMMGLFAHTRQGCGLGPQTQHYRFLRACSPEASGSGI